MAYHQPVLLNIVLKYLQPQSNQDFIDCTIGQGGHTEKLLEAIAPNGRVLGIDLDRVAITSTRERLQRFGSRLQLAQANFADLLNLAQEYGFNQVTGILFDLGLSSAQLADRKRGFSFQLNAPLDMRFGGNRLTAAEIINQYPEKRLAEIFFNYGQERFARQLARTIVEARRKKPIRETQDLVQLITQFYHQRPKPKKIHPATKIFQALRIEVNQELENLMLALPQALELLKSTGKLVVISYHSLEDRIVKDFFKQESRDCLCPKEFPKCLCQHKKALKIITKKPLVPSISEKIKNPRSRSAKLRVAQKL